MIAAVSLYLSLMIHKHYLFHRLERAHVLCVCVVSSGMKPGMKVLDVGCGVGGPMRNMAQFSGSNIDGITLNQYQVNVGEYMHLCVTLLRE